MMINSSNWRWRWINLGGATLYAGCSLVGVDAVTILVLVAWPIFVQALEWKGWSFGQELQRPVRRSDLLLIISFLIAIVVFAMTMPPSVLLRPPFAVSLWALAVIMLLVDWCRQRREPRTDQ